MGRRSWVGLFGTAAAGVGVLMAAGPAQATPNLPLPGYTQHNIVADRPGHAVLTDPNLVNPWGMSRGPNSPIWVSNNGTSTSTLYTRAVGMTPPSIVPLVVKIPAGSPTGQAFNDTNEFHLPGTTDVAHFIFASETGNITAWNSGTAAALVKHVAGANFKGLALAHSPFGPVLLAANFATGRVNVFNGQFTMLNVPLLFHDSGIPAGYAPFNVAELNGHIYVAYAKVGPTGDDVAGPGHGFDDVYAEYGALIRRLVSHGVLDSPWGLAIAPAGFGVFSHDLLVGNFGNGWINVFNPATGRFLGSLRTRTGAPIVIDGLWALLVGDPAAGGVNSVWFSAGPDHEAHGLVGTLTAT